MSVFCILCVYLGYAEKSSLLACDVVSRYVKDRFTFVFRTVQSKKIDCLVLKMKALRTSETSVTTDPDTQRYTSADFNFQ